MTSLIEILARITREIGTLVGPMIKMVIENNRLIVEYIPAHYSKVLDDDVFRKNALMVLNHWINMIGSTEDVQGVYNDLESGRFFIIMEEEKTGLVTYEVDVSFFAKYEQEIGFLEVVGIELNVKSYPGMPQNIEEIQEMEGWE